MTGNVKFKIGETVYELHLDDRDEMETIHKMAVLGNPPTYCKEMPDGRMSLDSNKDKEGNVYVNVVCKGKDQSGQFAIYKAKLGRYKTGGYFWHGFEKWDMKFKGESSTKEMVEEDEDFGF